MKTGYEGHLRSNLLYGVTAIIVSASALNSCWSRPVSQTSAELQDSADAIDYVCLSAFSQLGEAVKFELGSTFYRVTDSSTGKVLAEANEQEPRPASTKPKNSVAQCHDDEERGIFEVTLSLGDRGTVSYVRQKADGSRTRFTYSNMSEPAATTPSLATSADVAHKSCTQEGFEGIGLEDHRQSFRSKTRVGNCTVFWDEGTSAEDRDQVTAWARATEVEVSQVFSSVGAGDIISSMPKCTLYVATRPTCLLIDKDNHFLVNQGAALGLQGESSEIHMLAPSSHIGQSFGVAELPRASYWQKVYAHELFQGAMHALNAKRGRYTFDSCPSWFVQGIEEYFGVTRTDSNTPKTWRLYAKVAHQILPNVQFDKRVTWTNLQGERRTEFDYFFGTMLVRYLALQSKDGEARALGAVAAQESDNCEISLITAFGAPQKWKPDFTHWLGALIQ